MKVFKDNEGRSWDVTINVDAVKRVRSLLGVDLLEAVEGKLIERLVSDPVLLCDVVYALCKPQADEWSVADEEFGRAMAGDAIEHATQAVLEELVSFFPGGRGRVLRKALIKLNSLQQRALEHAEAQIDSGKMEEALNAALRLPGSSSTAAPGSSVSTPDL